MRWAFAASNFSRSVLGREILVCARTGVETCVCTLAAASKSNARPRGRTLECEAKAGRQMETIAGVVLEGDCKRGPSELTKIPKTPTVIAAVTPAAPNPIAMAIRFDTRSPLITNTS